MNSTELTRTIREFALGEAGFDAVGFSAASLPPLHEEAAERWVGDGFAGTMEYMSRDVRRRAHPESSLPSARTVIALAVNYNHPEDPRPAAPAGRVAKYAYGLDYHRTIEKKLKRLAAFVREAGGPGTEAKGYVDTGPVLERAFARQAGLGFFGKNTNVITKEFGSWVFLASLLTSLVLDRDDPHAGSCGTCRLCLDACPTGALVGDYRLDATKCISYLTIEHKVDQANEGGAPIDPELRRGMGDWIFGCDVCQDVCPYNRKKPVTRHAELYPEKRAGSWIELGPLEEMKDDAVFAEAFRGSPLKRPKRAGLLRSAAVVGENLAR
ncbi:MAG TPA: tRNA epoxyqueuosine(34) reductase QueG [Candidatus Eisenbacteria bacterium]|nr:tRNA epoxyqueuosine(34) reductase QueG [Candidatus Eisenbacteria bacterium]